MAERRRRPASGIREELAVGLRERAERFLEMGGVYARLGEMNVRRAERIERGLEPVTVQGWELPDGVLKPGDNPSSPYVLHPDDRVTTTSTPRRNR